AAGMALTKVLSHEGAPHNVLVNAMLVGFIEADQHVQAAKRAGTELKDYMAARAKDIPLGRIGRAEEFANMACFLVSDLGSYITRTAINVDGGRSPVVEGRHALDHVRSAALRGRRPARRRGPDVCADVRRRG